jgi:AraC-like DNA-binding protein
LNFQQEFLNSLKTNTALTKSLSLIEYLPDSVEVSLDIEENLPYIQAYKSVSCIYPYYYASSELNSYCIILTESGAGTLSINNEINTLTSDSIAIINCMELHRLEIKQSTWNYKILFINGNPVSYLVKCILENDCIITLPLHSTIPGMIHKLFEQLDKNKMNSLYFSKFLLDILFEFIVENNKLAQMQKPIPTYILEIKNDFDLNYHKNFSLDGLEQEYGISRFRICREFVKYFNESPIQYLNYKRIMVAKDILLQTDKRINEVGQLVGFENTNHFIRLFKQKTGVTPLEYRRTSPVNTQY